MDLYDLNHKVNAQENIVGWWATGNEVENKNYFKFFIIVQNYVLEFSINSVNIFISTLSFSNKEAANYER